MRAIHPQRLVCRLAFASFALLLVAVTAHAQPIAPETKEALLKGMEKVILEQAFVPGIDFSKWPQFLEKRRDEIDKAADVPAFAQNMNRVLREFGLSHFDLRTPRAAQARRKSEAVGVGVFAGKISRGLRVEAVAPMGPAANSGVEAGDIIVEADGRAPESVGVLEGAEGSKLAIKLEKPDGVVKEVLLERRKFSTVRPETLTWVGETVVLRIHSFDIGYNRANVEKLLGDGAGAAYLVLDLRSNSGGWSANVRHLLSLLLPDGSVIGTNVSRTMAQRYAEATAGDATDTVAVAKWSDSKVKTKKGGLEPFKGKVAVLINRRTASASEIVAAALKETLQAPLVGSPSAGAVLTATYASLSEGFELHYPVSDFVTANGVRLEGNPLQPDVEAPDPRRNEPDVAIARAIERLRGAPPLPGPGL